MSATVSEPTTAAGRAFFAEMEQMGLAHAMNGAVGVAILAIEREAAAAALRHLGDVIDGYRTIDREIALALVVDALDAAPREGERSETELRKALRACEIAAHFGGVLMDEKTPGAREQLAYIERRAAAALRQVPDPKVVA